jgi:hypothetical protein
MVELRFQVILFIAGQAVSKTNVGGLSECVIGEVNGNRRLEIKSPKRNRMKN